MFRYLNSRLLKCESKSNAKVSLILVFSVILTIALAIYYDEMVIPAESIIYDDDDPYASIFLPIQQFIDFLYSKFLNAFVISDTFIDDLLKSVIALFVVVNPIGKIPLFITLTQKMEKENKKLVSKNAIVTTAVLLTAFAIAGIQLLSVFGISIFSFMIDDGVLLFIISIEFLTDRE